MSLEYGGNFQPKASEHNPLARKRAARKRAVSLTRDHVVALAAQARDLDDFAAHAGVSISAAAVFIERALRGNADIDITRFVPNERRSLIEEQFMTLQSSSIARVARALEGRAAEAEIRIVRGWLQGKIAREQWG